MVVLSNIIVSNSAMVFSATSTSQIHGGWRQWSLTKELVTVEDVVALHEVDVVRELLPGLTWRPTAGLTRLARLQTAQAGGKGSVT